MYGDPSLSSASVACPCQRTEAKNVITRYGVREQEIVRAGWRDPAELIEFFPPLQGELCMPRSTGVREWPFVGCTATAVVTAVYRREGNDRDKEALIRIEKLKGQLIHADACLVARPIAAPVLSLHPAVREQARQLVEKGVRSSTVLFENQQFLFRDFAGAVATKKHRLVLEPQVCVGS